MPDGIRWVGLDVHARESTIAVFDQATGELATKRVVGRPHELLPLLRAVERPARMVYEAGPTGYGLARRALAEGIELSVCAPSKTERPADRVKTESVTRSAWRGCWPPASSCWSRSRLWSVSNCATGPLPRGHPLRPGPRAASDRELPAAPRDLLGGPGEAWTRKHRSWLTSIRFSDHASQATLADYLHATTC